MFGYLEIGLALGLLSILLANWDTILYYLLRIIYYFLEKIDVEIHFLLLSLITILLILTLFIFYFNKEKIKQLSYCDYMPVDEYEMKKQEWTKAALLELEQNPKFIYWKEKLEQEEEDKKKKEILSKGSSESRQYMSSISE